MCFCGRFVNRPYGVCVGFCVILWDGVGTVPYIYPPSPREVAKPQVLTEGVKKYTNFPVKRGLSPFYQTPTGLLPPQSVYGKFLPPPPNYSKTIGRAQRPAPTSSQVGKIFFSHYSFICGETTRRTVNFIVFLRRGHAPALHG